MIDNNELSGNVVDFYNNISKKYTESINRCVPYYTEMLESVFMYLPNDFKPSGILELGCGTGNLTEMICNKYPQAKITAIDISDECIGECKKRITSSNIDYIKCDFKDLDFPPNCFDLVVSSLSIHHIPAEEKQKLFKKLFLFQTTKAMFSFCDQCKGETDYIYKKNISEWKNFAFSQGSKQEEWDMWMSHQKEHDYHDTLSDHVLWLKNAGYKITDCTKKHLLWTSFYAEK